MSMCGGTHDSVCTCVWAHLWHNVSMSCCVLSSAAMESHRRSQGAESLVELLCVASKAFSLPASIKSKVENSTGVSTPLQVSHLSFSASVYVRVRVCIVLCVCTVLNNQFCV